MDALLSSENPDVRQLGLRAVNLGVLNWSIWSQGQGRSLVEEQRLISETVLSTLWRNRSRREPCLVVIDEAHNVCPSKPADPITALASGYAALIAAEGRKFGADLGYLSDTFSFVAPSLIQRATTFGLGETLVAGKFFPRAGYVKFGARISQEGGADIPIAWAAPA